MNELITFGAFVGGIWALSLLGLKSIRDSERADEPTRDAAAVAIIAVNILGSAGGAYALGAAQFQNEGLAAFGGGLGLWLFAAPYVARVAVYGWKKWISPKPEVAAVSPEESSEKGSTKSGDDSDEETKTTAHAAV